MPVSGWKRVFLAGDGRLRSGWRILLFTVLFLAFMLTGVFILGVVGIVGPSTTVSPAALFWPGLVMLAAAILAGRILLTQVDDRPPGALGFAWTRHTPRELGIGLLVGGGSLALVVGVVVLAGWIAYRPDEGTLGTYVYVLLQHLLILAVPAAAEEALFRGYPFQALVEGVGAVTATLLASGAFALAHVENPEVGPFALLNIFLAGVLLSVAYLRTRSLWFATAVHLGWNWAMASVFDLPVSGLGFFDTPLYEPVATGPDWMTGGVFGPEGGLVASMAVLAALVAVIKLPGLDETPEMRERRPLVDQ